MKTGYHLVSYHVRSLNILASCLYFDLFVDTSICSRMVKTHTLKQFLVIVLSISLASIYISLYMPVYPEHDGLCYSSVN